MYKTLHHQQHNVDDVVEITKADVTLDVDERGVAKRLGMGGTSTVYSGRVLLGATSSNPQCVSAAVKMYDDGMDVAMRREITALAKLRDSTIVRLYAVIVSDDDERAPIGLALELMECSLNTYVKMRRSNLRELCGTFDVVCRSIQFMHSLGIVHGDIKPENILVNKAGDPKLGDFGNAHSNTVATGHAGTVMYEAPEVAAEGVVTKACDIFSLGMTFWTLLHMEEASRPFGPRLTRPSSIMHQLGLGHRPTIGGRVPEDLRDLITACWDHDPSKRPTIDTVLERIHAIASSTCASAQCVFGDGELPHVVAYPIPNPDLDLLPAIKAIIPPQLRSTYVEIIVSFVNAHEAALRSKYFGLTRNHIIALVTYTVDFDHKDYPNIHSKLNRLLLQRPTAEGLGAYLPLYATLMQALKVLPTKRYDYLFRGLLTQKSDTYEAGSTLHLVAFTSTSTMHAIMLSFAGRDGTLMMIRDAKGYPLYDFSLYHGEYEVLLAPNTCISVTSSVSGEAAKDLLVLTTNSSLQVSDLVIAKCQSDEPLTDPTSLAPEPPHNPRRSPDCVPPPMNLPPSRAALMGSGPHTEADGSCDYVEFLAYECEFLGRAPDNTPVVLQLTEFDNWFGSPYCNPTRSGDAS